MNQPGQEFIDVYRRACSCIDLSKKTILLRESSEAVVDLIKTLMNNEDIMKYRLVAEKLEALDKAAMHVEDIYY